MLLGSCCLTKHANYNHLNSVCIVRTNQEKHAAAFPTETALIMPYGAITFSRLVDKATFYTLRASSSELSIYPMGLLYLFFLLRKYRGKTFCYSTENNAVAKHSSVLPASDSKLGSFIRHKAPS